MANGCLRIDQLFSFFLRGRKRERACIRGSGFEEKFEKRAMNFEKNRKEKGRNEFDKLFFFFFLFKSPGIKFAEKQIFEFLSLSLSSALVSQQESLLL